MTVRAPLTPELVELRLSELQQLCRMSDSLLEAELPPIDRRVLERRCLRVVGRAPGDVADARDVRLHVLATAIDRQLGWMPDAWVEPTSGDVVGVGLTVLAGGFVGERAVDALPRGCDAIIALRFVMPRPACVDALPRFEHPDQHARLWLCSSRDRARTQW